MISIRRTLTLRLLATMLAGCAIAGACLYAYVHARLTAEFDDALRAKARAVGGIFQFDARDGLEYNPSQAELFEFRAGGDHPIYFEVWRPDGAVAARSPSLGLRDVPRVPFTGNSAVVRRRLPDGRHGRIAFERIQPRVEEDEGPVPQASVPVLTVCVAQEPAELKAALRILASGLVLCALLLAGGGALAVMLSVRRGLRPLDRLGSDADAIGARLLLDHRFTTTSLPAELQPIAARLNALMARVADAFARERRFTADVAHELRTPVAELRTLAEVALKWPDDARPGQTYGETLQIARQMEALISRLLSIARCAAGAHRVQRERIDLSAILRQSSASHAPSAALRGVRTTLDFPESLPIDSDGAMLSALVDNLVSNAVTYASRDGSVHVEAQVTDDGRVEFSVRNACDGLTADDLPHMLEPFWRKDAARTGGNHCGLGLVLVATYADALGLQLQLDLPEPHTFVARVSGFAAPVDAVADPPRNAQTHVDLNLESGATRASDPLIAAHPTPRR